MLINVRYDMKVPKLFFNKQRDPEEILVQQFYITLKNTYCEAMLSERALYPDLADNRDEIKEHLQSFEKNGDCDTYSCWTDFYRIERLLILFYNDQMIETEIMRRLVSAKTVLYPNLARFYEEEFAALEKSKAPADEKRSLLTWMISDLQWQYQKLERMRQYERKIRVNIGVIFYTFLVSWIVVMIMDFLCLSKAPQFITIMNILAAAFSGTIGACFSIMLSLNDKLRESSLEELKTISNPVYHIRRELIGFGAGVIAYFFILSGMMSSFISNDILPTLTGDVAVKDVATLVIWCFIAGFFEKFIPGILEKASQKTNLETENKKGK